MKVRNPIPFERKLFNPCKKLLHFFKLRLGKPIFIRALQFRQSKYPARKPRKRVSARVLSIFDCLRPSRDMDRVLELKSISDAGHSRAPFPSPLTPAYVKMSAAIEEEVAGEGEVEDACRSFENYLVDMIVDEGKMRDLMDVEELLHCWKNLKSPVFIDLVCRFYGELCRDLFSDSHQRNASASKTLLH